MATYCESSHNSGGSSKRAKTSEDGGYSNSCPTPPHTDDDDSPTPIRPPGVKACKKRGKQVQSEGFNSSSTDKYEKFYESSGEFSASLNHIANVKAESLKQQPGKIQALLKAKKIEKMAKKFDKEARELEIRGKKMDMLFMLMGRGENLSDEEKMVKSTLLHELFPQN